MTDRRHRGDIYTTFWKNYKTTFEISVSDPSLCLNGIEYYEKDLADDILTKAGLVARGETRPAAPLVANGVATRRKR